MNRRGKKSLEIPFIDTMEIRESIKNKVEITLNLNEGEKNPEQNELSVETSSKSKMELKPLNISL